MSAEKFVGQRIFGLRTFLSPASASVRIFLSPASRRWIAIAALYSWESFPYDIVEKYTTRARVSRQRPVFVEIGHSIE